MVKYKIVEGFVSINGEGPKAGELAVFIRFQGCNLSCSYCDTAWANKDEVSGLWMDETEIYDYIKGTGVRNVTITGGEPLIKKDIMVLLEKLSQDKDLQVEIETNGSAPIAMTKTLQNPPAITMDYKLGSSGMEAAMLTENFQYLDQADTVKFVSGSMADLERALEIMETYQLIGKCHLYLSPVFGAIELPAMVEFMKEHQLNGVRMQLQLHKYIWSPETQGV